MNRHFDLAANEAGMRRAEAESYEGAMARAGDDEERAFVDMQRRMRDVCFAPRLEAMRSHNEGLPAEMPIEAFAVKAGVALFSMASILEIPLRDVLAVFSEGLGDTVAAVLERDGSEGAFGTYTDVYTPAGNA